MNRRQGHVTTVVAIVLLCAAARGGLVTARIGTAAGRCGKLVVTRGGEKAGWTVTVDLSGLPGGTKIQRAGLYVRRAAGRTDVVLTGPGGGKAELVGPWFDRFDVARWVKAGARVALRLSGPEGIDGGKVYLRLEYEGKVGKVPPQVKGVRVFHRAGQTFVTWGEIEKRISAENVTWGRLKTAIDEVDAQRVVRYRVYRHTRRITATNIGSAKPQAAVRPLSGYNVEGRSVERLIAIHRRRAIDDIAFARKLARGDYFRRYTMDMPEMGEVTVDRFVIDDSGKQLALGTGLYVHNTDEAGQAYYAVAACVDGVTNTVDFSADNATQTPVAETVGPGEPVFQAAGTLKVFYDHPGQRRYYVQWAGRGMANRPNRYYNWSVYVPPNPPKPTPVRVAFTRDRFMRPAVPHRRDTILVSGRDGPVWSFWYGYHEAMGTLKSFRQGRVRAYTKRRLFAFVDWVMKTFGGDPKRLSAIGGTDALYYGVKHGDRFAYVLASSPDPNPQVTPAETRIDNYRRRRPREKMEEVWGKVEWKVHAADGKPIWDEFDLIRHVADDPKRECAFLSMGPSSLSAPWPRQVALMKALWASKQAYTARFYWGGGAYLPIPEGKVGAKGAFDFAMDVPMLALRNNSNDRGLTNDRFAKGAAGYWGGGRIADGRRWLADFVDLPDRFEITIHGDGDVGYRGGGTSDVTPRRTTRFRPKPGQRFRWENVPLDARSRDKHQSGQVTADEHGLVTIPQVNFGRSPSRLKIRKAD